uniref:Perilipin n=1 Tax=Anser cygnoides TaxID=8845 RepID=A0A8B9EDD6_ANSCY
GPQGTPSPPPKGPSRGDPKDEPPGCAGPGVGAAGQGHRRVSPPPRGTQPRGGSGHPKGHQKVRLGGARGCGLPWGSPPKRQHRADPAQTRAKSFPALGGDPSGGSSAPNPNPLPHPKTSPSSGSGASGCPRKLVGLGLRHPTSISVPSAVPCCHVSRKRGAGGGRAGGAGRDAEGGGGWGHCFAPPPAHRPRALRQSVVSRVASLALVSSARGAVSTAYASTKESHPYVRSVCDVAEKGVRTLTAAAVSGAQPLLTKLEPQISTANEYACKGLDKLEEKLPILQQPTETVTLCAPPCSGDTRIEPWASCWDKPALHCPPPQVVAGTRELVSSTVTGAREAVSGAVGLARGAVQGSVERTRRALSTGISTVAGSRVGQLLATGADTVLEKSEELVEHYLPGTDEEPAAPVADSIAAASLEQQRRRQSCFVRVGSLSAKLRHRALRRSLGELQRARHSAQHALAQLHRVIELIEQGMDGSLRGARQHLHRMWLEWSQQDGVPMEDTQVFLGGWPCRGGLRDEGFGPCPPGAARSLPCRWRRGRWPCCGGSCSNCRPPAPASPPAPGGCRAACRTRPGTCGTAWRACTPPWRAPAPSTTCRTWCWRRAARR